jgi:hypothetical protein
MGRKTEVDLTQLRALADHVTGVAAAIAEMRWPWLGPDELRDSAVAGIAAPDVVAARLAEMVANLRDWAHAAHMSADAFERADGRNVARYDVP